MRVPRCGGPYAVTCGAIQTLLTAGHASQLLLMHSILLQKDEPSELTPALLTQMCADVAEGMAYLAKVHIVHR